MDNKILIETIRDNIINKLIDNSFIVQVYNSYTTNSSYIKLDYGVCNSIRISDHHGNSKLAYRYNVILDEPDNIIEEKYMRYYYSQNTYERLIEQILFDRMIKRYKYKGNYNTFMEKNRNMHQNDKKGFWGQAKTIYGRRAVEA